MVETIAPLVPPEVDLRKLPYMPLQIMQLLDSDLFGLSSGDEFKAAVALWCKSWHQVPAGSLPDNDRMLKMLSLAGDRWKKVRAMALHGWVTASDGRLYHPVIAEKVLEAWANLHSAGDKGKDGSRDGYQAYRNQQRDKARKRWSRRPDDAGHHAGDDAGHHAGDDAGHHAGDDAGHHAGDDAGHHAGDDAGHMPIRNRIEGKAAAANGTSGAIADAGHDAGDTQRCAAGHDAGKDAGHAAVDLIGHADRAIAAVYGADQQRAWPAATDLTVAKRWITAGIGPETVADVVTAVCQRRKAQGKPPPKALSYFADAVRDAARVAEDAGTATDASGGRAPEDSRWSEHVGPACRALHKAGRPDAAAALVALWRKDKDGAVDYAKARLAELDGGAAA